MGSSDRARLQAVSDGEAGLRVNSLPAIVDLEQPVRGSVVAHWDITTLFEPVRDDPSIFSVEQPLVKIHIRFFDEHGQGHGVGAFKLVEDVGEFRILRRAICVDDRPEGGRLLRRGLRIETRKVELGQECGDVTEALALVPLPEIVPVGRNEIVLRLFAPGDEMAPVVGRQVNSVCLMV